MRIGAANGWLKGASRGLGVTGRPAMEMSIGLGVVGWITLDDRGGMFCLRRLVAGRLTGVDSCRFLGGRSGVVRVGLGFLVASFFASARGWRVG